MVFVIFFPESKDDASRSQFFQFFIFDDDKLLIRRRLEVERIAFFFQNCFQLLCQIDGMLTDFLVEIIRK